MKISVKTILITVSVVLIVLIGGVFLFIQTQTVQTQNPETNGIFGNLFPFVSNNNNGTGGDVVDDQNETPERAVPLLRQITDKPVSGAYIYLDDEEKPTIRYVEKETGNIYEVPADSYNSTRITNTTIPGTHEAVWIDENNIVLRYFSDGEIETFYAKLKPDATEQSLNGSFVDSWDKTSFDRESGNFFSLFESPNGSTLTFGKIDASTKNILVSPIKSWIPLQTEKGFFVQTAPNSSVEGSLFEIRSGQLNEVVGGLYGLSTSVNPAGNYAMIGFLSNGQNMLSVVDLNKNVSRGLPIQTLTSKCAWHINVVYCGVPSNLQSSLPERWSTGDDSFDDSIWKVDIENNVGNIVINPSKEGVGDVDVWQPMVDETESYMIFINKRDLTLWSLRLKENVSESESTE